MDPYYRETGARAVADIRWGILGTGWVVENSFLPAIRGLGSAHSVQAVASRTQPQAELFARREGVPIALEGYEKLLENPDVDVIYIALPNHLHEEWTVRALAAGKHVLCEKPLGMEPDSVERMIDAARSAPGFLWEAYAFLFRSQTAQLRTLVQNGAIGELIKIDSTFYTTISASNYRWDTAMGGGALYDLAVYALRLADLWFQEAQRARTVSTMRGSVDVESSGQVVYQGGTVLEFTVGLDHPYQTSATLWGTRGRIEIPNPYNPQPEDVFTVIDNGVHPFRAAQHVGTFRSMLAHIGNAVLERESPQYLADDASLRVNRVLALLRAHRAARPEPGRD